jgi:cytoskeletal protein CcmA (bactofilin family)
MSKPTIQNITVTQTFQNWFDKTNEMVDIMRDSAMTASISGDTTTGDARLLGEFTANTIIAFNVLEADNIQSVTTGNTIQYTSPIQITGTTSPVVATFNFAASGGRTRYTNGTLSWDVGIEDSTNGRFIINAGATNRFALSTSGVLTIPAIVAEDIEVSNDLIVDGTIFGSISANNVSVSGSFTGNLNGNLIGDVFAPNGTTKILENGNGTTIPATLTGNVNGTVSSLTNHTTNSLTEGSNNLYFTTARARASVSAGTGVTYNSGTGVISIGQAVGTGSNVTFNTVTTGGNVTVDGTITATGDITAFASSSDVRKKENIEKINNALEKVLSIGGYTYNFIGDDTRLTGVIAQEIEKVLPEVVYEIDDEQFGEKTKAIRYGNIVGLLIEAIKELKEELEELKNGN